MDKQYKILISGKARSGKDTLVKFLIEMLELEDGYNKNYTRLAFADPMKKIAKIMFPQIEDEWLYGSSELRDQIIPNARDDENNPLTVRKLLLDLGKFGRQYNEDTWVNTLFYDYWTPDSMIISDCRFYNEFIKAKAHGFYAIRLKRPDNNYIINDISENDMNDVSDDNFNAIIINDGSLDDFREKIKNVVKDIKNMNVLALNKRRNL